MTLPPIGLSGFAGAGKTTVALYIEQKYGYERRHIAEPLRRMLASLLRDFGMREDEIERYLTGDLKESIIPCLGITSRQAQISIGTEWGRVQVRPDLWADLWARQALSSDRPVMNDSVRFPNEEEAICDAGGITILVTRPGRGPAAFKWGLIGRALYRWFGCWWGVHDSERVDRLSPSVVIENDGSLEILHAKIDAVMVDLTYNMMP
jgi:hypothetical protein